jgi:hypothetical protein
MQTQTTANPPHPCLTAHQATARQAWYKAWGYTRAGWRVYHFPYEARFNDLVFSSAMYYALKCYRSRQSSPKSPLVRAYPRLV